MKASSARFLWLHLMAAMLFFGCLAVAGEGIHMVWYGVAAVALWPTFGTLRDFIRYYRRDLEQHG